MNKDFRGILERLMYVLIGVLVTVYATVKVYDASRGRERAAFRQTFDALAREYSDQKAIIRELRDQIERLESRP